MLKQLQKRKADQKGFTIIEVLIVLAIAGLILLIVFLAVPALQRNSRNTQRKNDVQALLGGIQEWENNNSGQVPTVAADQAAAASNSKLGYYKAADVTWTGTKGVATALTTDTVNVVTGAKCDAGGATVAGSGRQIAIQYMYETSSGLQATCQDS
jgi:prepilin-type N-terminal cleavage/methylation domain-containing protein